MNHNCALFLLILIQMMITSINSAQWVQVYPHSKSHIIANDNYIFAADYIGVIRSSDNGATWTEVNNGLTNRQVTAIGLNGSNLFAGTYEGGIFLSTDYGNNWKTVNSGLTNMKVYSFAFSGINIFAGTQGGGVFLSTNNGTNWTPVNNGLYGLSNYALLANGAYLYAGTRGEGVFYSTNNGTNWLQYETGLTNLNINDLAVIGSNLFVGTDGGGVFVSTNNGKNWSSVNLQLIWLIGVKNYFANYFAVSGSNLFAAIGGDGIFQTSDNGVSWKSVTANLNSSYESLAIKGTDIYVCTFYEIWKRPLSEMITSVNNTSDNLPNEYSLKQNYPNPFNPSTTIKYSVPRLSVVQIKIYDLVGREIKTLISEEKQAGNYEIKYNASDIASGIYFCKMITNGFNQTKKIILIK